MIFWANAGLVLTVFAWGSTAPVVHQLLETWDPLVLTAARSLLTAPLFLVWLALAEGRAGFAPDVPWPKVAMLGAMLASFSVLFTLGINFANPITVAIMSAAGPIVAGFVDWIVNGRRMPGGVLAAVPFAIVGGLLAGVDFGSSGGLFRFAGGEPLILAAIVMWSFYSCLVQKWLPGTSQLRRTALTFIGASPVLIIVASVMVAFGFEALPTQAPSARGWGLFLWTCLAISILGTLFWNIGVHHVGIVVATMFLNMMPVVAVLVSMMFGIEPRLEQLIGGLIVIAAVIRAQWRPPSARGPSKLA